MPPIHSMTDDVTTAAEAFARRRATHEKFFPQNPGVNLSEVTRLRAELNQAKLLCKQAQDEREKLAADNAKLSEIHAELRQRVQHFEANDCLQGLDLHAIRKSVCKAFNAPLEVIMRKTRTAETVRMRHIALFLCRKLTSKSLPEIGRFFGGLDHTSVLNGVKRAQPVWDSLPKATGLTVVEMALNMRTAWDGIYGSTSAYNRMQTSHIRQEELFA